MSHRHRMKDLKVYPFTGPARGARQNPAAHGNITEVVTCSCGAQRETNINGSHVERGRWGRSVFGNLMDYKTGKYIRQATYEELQASKQAEPIGVIEVDGRSCWVEN